MKRKNRKIAVKSSYGERKTYVIDPETLEDLERIRTAIRAASDSETIRFCIRKTAKLMRLATDVGQVCIMLKGKGSAADELAMLEVPKLQ